MDLIADISDETPFVALRLLQVCGANKFGHILSDVPPGSSAYFCAQRDEAIYSAFVAIQGLPVDPVSSTHALYVVAGGARLPSLSQTTIASYLGAFFRFAGSLIERMSQRKKARDPLQEGM